MARNKDKIKKRNEQLLKKYNRLMNEKVNNKRKFTFSAVCSMLADEFFLDDAYVERLIQKLTA